MYKLVDIIGESKKKNVTSYCCDQKQQPGQDYKTLVIIYIYTTVLSVSVTTSIEAILFVSLLLILFVPPINVRSSIENLHQTVFILLFVVCVSCITHKLRPGLVK